MEQGTYSEALAAGFNESQATMLARLGMETRNEAIVESVAAVRRGQGWNTTHTTRLLRAWMVYTIDMGIAITAWIVGFGLEVQSWGAVIGLGVLSRFVFFVLSSIFAHDDARADQLARGKR